MTFGFSRVGNGTYTPPIHEGHVWDGNLLLFMGNTNKGNFIYYYFGG